jgi:hypothetical protein
MILVYALTFGTLLSRLFSIVIGAASDNHFWNAMRNCGISGGLGKKSSLFGI